MKIALSMVTSTYSVSWVGTVGETHASLVSVALANLADEKFTTDVRILPIMSATNNPRALVNNYNLSVPGKLGQTGSALYGIYDPADSGTSPMPTSWGSPVQKAQSTSAPVSGIQEWVISNPYGIVAIPGTNTMYMIDYDNANDNTKHDYSSRICSYNMARDAFSEGSTPVYIFNPGMSGTHYYKGAGTGLDLYNDNFDDYLIASFRRYYIESPTIEHPWGRYVYGPSALVKIPLRGSLVTSAAVNENANGVVVEGSFGYVVSYGNEQQAGGNVTSALQVINLAPFTPSIIQTKTVIQLDAALGAGNEFGGDFLDIAFVNNKAYVLLAHYNDTYTEYDYLIVQTTAATLQGPGFGTIAAAQRKTAKVMPASSCFALLPGGDNALYFVDGVNINTIDVTVDIGAAGAITPIAAAGDFANGTDTGYVLNSAAVVIEKSAVTAPMTLRGASKATVAKMTKRLGSPEDLERERK